MKTHNDLAGRDDEKKTLEEILSSSNPEFLAIYGRRRVGKTFLVRNFFRSKNVHFFHSTGINNEPMKQQLLEFTKEISRVFFHGTELKEKKNWFDTFQFLTDIFETQIPKNKKIVLFFDEFPWMATAKSRLIQALDYYWNRHWSQDSRIKLIICGSSASWIIKNIINDKGGLHNRLTKTILLDPMNLKETKNLLQKMDIRLNNKHITEIYMVTGGVPFYLSHISKGLSSSQNIEKLAFSKNSPLLTEFDKLYSSLFLNYTSYIEIIRSIAKHRYGISQEDLFLQIKNLTKGGTSLQKLKDLEDAGFIIAFTPFNHKKKGIYYKVIDEYSLFYFYWIEPIKESLIGRGFRKGYWDSLMKSPSWHSWAGYSFEALCYKHIHRISEALHLSQTAIPSSWKYTSKKNSEESGAQIDLLFDRDDDAITICEIKYSQIPFVIDKEYAKNLKNKIEIFKKQTKTKKQIFLAIISANGLKKTMYSEELVDAVITLEDLY
ncbi:MAG: ATP-binding protein [Chlamydiota bacterium]